MRTIDYAKVRQHKGVPLKPEQVRVLLRAFDDEQARTAFLTFVLTGVRKSELTGGAGIAWPDGFRRCHDLRVTCGTNDAIAGMNPAKLQVKLGHSDFRVTQRYVNLAGVVFAEEAAALEARLLGPVESSTDLSEPERIEQRDSAWNGAESAPLD